jgi:hypothetical protein
VRSPAAAKASKSKTPKSAVKEGVSKAKVSAKRASPTAASVSTSAKKAKALAGFDRDRNFRTHSRVLMETGDKEIVLLMDSGAIPLIGAAARARWKMGQRRRKLRNSISVLVE